MACSAARVSRRHDARRRTRHDRIDGGRGDQPGRDRAAVTLHHQDVAIEAPAGQLLAQTREIAIEHGLHRGIDRRRHAALELAILRQDGVARRDIVVGPQTAHDLGGAALVRRIDVAVQEVDDDGFAALCQQLFRCPGDRGLVKRHQHLAVGIHALGHLKAILALDQGMEGTAQAIRLRPRAAAELQHVAEALGGDQSDPRGLALE
jgi:hypothetical protein